MRLSTDPALGVAVETFAGAARITAVEAIPYRVHAADRVLVRVHTDAGLVGHAEAQSALLDVRALDDALFGVDPLRGELVARRCELVTGNQVARGAVDLAVWDLIGQVLDVPCHTLLGGFADDVAVAHSAQGGAVRIEPARSGFTEARRVLGLCLARGVPLVVGSRDGGAIAAVATVTFAAAFAAIAGLGVELPLDWEDDLAVGPEINAGRAAVPAGAGLGVAIDEGRLERYRLDRVVSSGRGGGE